MELKATTTEKTHEFTGLIEGTTYTVQVIVTDKANKSTTVTKMLTSKTTYTWDKYSLNETKTYHWNKYDTATKYLWNYSTKTTSDLGEGVGFYQSASFDENSNLASLLPPGVGYTAFAGNSRAGFLYNSYTSGKILLNSYMILDSEIEAEGAFEGNGDYDYAKRFYQLISITSNSMTVKEYTSTPYTAKGTNLQGTVTSTSSNEYPTDGLSGSYWYVYSDETTDYSKGSTSHGQVTSKSSSSYSGTTNGKFEDYWYDYAGKTINWALN